MSRTIGKQAALKLYQHPTEYTGWAGEEARHAKARKVLKHVLTKAHRQEERKLVKQGMEELA